MCINNMKSVRIFVANLPKTTKEKDLNNLFYDYGQIERIEIKEPKATSGEDEKIIAFVTIKTDNVEYCINELNWQTVQGSKIKVSLAKESFLDRLKREREEAISEEEVKTVESNSAPLLPENTENTRKIFNEDYEANDDDIDAHLLITKKRAAHSIRDGKIIIANFDQEPVHIIENKKTNKKQKLDEKSTHADEKRKLSLKKLTDQYKQKATAIKKALSSVDAPLSKKIKFDIDEEEIEDKNETKNQLFNSDDEDVTDFKLKPEHFSKKNAQLVKLQSEQTTSDTRFKLDAKFLDNNNENSNEVPKGEEEEEEENERDWQMGILEQVIGKKLVYPTIDGKKPKTNKQMLRYDPTSVDHEQFLRAPAKKEEKKTKEIDNVENEKIKKNIKSGVSKDVFYVVSDSLAESIKTSNNNGFSLLEMFGRSKQEALEEREDQLKKVSNEKILINNTNWNAGNPFKYDSSDTEEEEEEDVKSALKNTKTEISNNTKKSKQKNKQFIESFFFSKDDARFEEGAKFFTYENENNNTDYSETRDRLNLLIKKQINKKKKQKEKSNGGIKKRKRVK